MAKQKTHEEEVQRRANAMLEVAYGILGEILMEEARHQDWVSCPKCNGTGYLPAVERLRARREYDRCHGVGGAYRRRS